MKAKVYFASMRTKAFGDGLCEKLGRLMDKAGIDQIDFHQGNPFRQGDFHFKDAAYPNGVSDFRRMTDELKKHGMMAGLHTYSEFVVNGSKYLTPVPHKDLDVMNTYTLTEDLTAESKDVPVEESTENIEFVLAYTRRNSHYVRIDDELLEFTELGTNGFLKCKRGACGTVVGSTKKARRSITSRSTFSATSARTRRVTFSWRSRATRRRPTTKAGSA